MKYKTAGTEDIYNGVNSRAAGKTLPVSLHKIGARKIEYLKVANQLSDLASPPGNHLEELHGDRAGQHSIRINEKYRICFVWTEYGPTDVEITDYH